MGINRGKQFELVFKECCKKVDGVSIDRLHDQTNGFAGSSNICDFIVYKKPYEYYFECKSIHGNTFPLSNLTDKQYKGLLEKSKIKGVVAGVIVWWIDKDVTRFIPIKTVYEFKSLGYKSIRYDSGIPDYLNYADSEYCISDIKGKKKRVFFDYDMQDFFDSIEERKGERE